MEGGRETLHQHIQRPSQRELTNVLGCGDRPDEGLEICGLTSQIEYHIKLKFQSIQNKVKKRGIWEDLKVWKHLCTSPYLMLYPSNQWLIFFFKPNGRPKMLAKHKIDVQKCWSKCLIELGTKRNYLVPLNAGFLFKRGWVVFLLFQYWGALLSYKRRHFNILIIDQHQIKNWQNKSVQTTMTTSFYNWVHCLNI